MAKYKKVGDVNVGIYKKQKGSSLGKVVLAIIGFIILLALLSK